MSTSVDWERVKTLFGTAAELPAAEREAFLQRECGGAAALRKEVESLLAADLQTGGFFDQPAFVLPGDLFSGNEPDSVAGQQFGPYKVLREIGRGGLGTVYLAERTDDVYRKEVALKLVRRGLDTEDILVRFRHERQILARLDHPNIARLFDGGTSEDGRPFFVMEYVQGETLQRYCEQHRLSLEERLQLFRKVCAAVTYAHQSLVIHRDLKPSNILVTPDGEPKLLDFGIAKLLTAEEENFTVTAEAQRVLTPEYASPEQITGGRITTASDVYSLGVLLYELLSGQKPYQLKTRTTEEMARVITEQEPERPSTAALTEKVHDSPFTHHHSQLLRGDLDNIVLMALRKEPERRYGSVAEFSEDLRRHLNALPVLAHPNHFSYRAAKFIRRNRAGVLAAALVLLALIGGLLATLWQAQRAQSEKARAERRFGDVRKLANTYLFDVYPVVENLEGSLKAREMILTNALKYLDSLAAEAAGDVTLQAELATAYEKVGDVQGAMNNSSLGDTQAGIDTYSKARKLRAAILASDPGNLDYQEKLAGDTYVIARTLWSNSQTARAEKAFAEALTLRRALLAAKPDSVQYQDRLAVVLIDYGAIPVFNSQTEKALQLFNEALAIVEKLRAKDPTNLAFAKTQARLLRTMSRAKSKIGDYAGGLADLQTAHRLSVQVAEAAPQDFRMQRAVWLTDNLISELFIDQGNATEALKATDDALQFPTMALQKEPENAVVAYDLAVAWFNAARASRLAKDHPQTIEKATQAVAVMRTLSQKSPQNVEYSRNVAAYQTELAGAQIELRQTDAALATLAEVRAALIAAVAADPEATYQLDLGTAYRLSAQAFHQKNDDLQAADFADQALAILRKLKAANSLADADATAIQELEDERLLYQQQSTETGPPLTPGGRQ